MCFGRTVKSFHQSKFDDSSLSNKVCGFLWGIGMMKDEWMKNSVRFMSLHIEKKKSAIVDSFEMDSFSLKQFIAAMTHAITGTNVKFHG